VNLLSLIILVPFLAGLASLLLLPRVRKLQWVVLFLTSLFLAFMAFRLYGKWELSLTLRIRQYALTLTNRPMGWIFFAITSAVMFFISLFSLSYNDKKHATGVAPLWTILLASNAGIFFAGDWIAFLVAWEIMGWTSFFIISHGRASSFRAGIYYYALTMVGAAALLAAVFLIVRFTGTWEIDRSMTVLAGMWGKANGLLYGLSALLMVTFFAKSAVGPFYMWPAMAHAEAPDDFSSFLSGIMIKYGIFGLLITIVPLYSRGYAGALVGSTPAALYIMGWIGALTAASGTLLALRENDMKRLMAFSTVSNVGFIVLALSVNTVFGIAAAIFHTFNHMVFKGTIFLSMASVKFRTGERDMHRLGGMAYRMPVAFFAFLLGIISAAGIPPMAGFASKWMIFQSLFGQRLLILAIPAFLASTGAFMYLYRGLHSIYLGQLSPRFAKIKPAPPLQSISMILMMLSIYAVGTWPGIFLVPINQALASFTGTALPSDMSAITGVTANINLTMVSAVFLGAFLLVLLFYVLGKPRTHVEPLDTYTSGEDPADWNMTPEQYHYAYRFYEPFEKMINPTLERFSLERGFGHIIYNTGRFCRSAGRWMSSRTPGVLVTVTALVVILWIGISV